MLCQIEWVCRSARTLLHTLLRHGSIRGGRTADWSACGPWSADFFADADPWLEIVCGRGPSADQSSICPLPKSQLLHYGCSSSAHLALVLLAGNKASRWRRQLLIVSVWLWSVDVRLSISCSSLAVSQSLRRRHPESHTPTAPVHSSSPLQ